MAYVVPNSTVVLLKNISLTPTYENTVDYDNAAAQYNDMYAHKLGQWDRCTYVGKNKQQGTIRLESTQGLLMQQATYMMFKNTSYEDKWFYAFVTNVTWVNNATWEVSFILDVMQTYYFDFTYQECFIERGHVHNDKIGNNIVEEKLNTGEYIVNYQKNITQFTDLVGAVCCTLKPTGEQQDGFVTSQIDKTNVAGSIYAFGSLKDYQDFFIKATESNPDDTIIDTYMLPRLFATGGAATGVFRLESECEHLQVECDKPQSHTDGTLSGYTPKNNKLYTYPYCYMKLTNFSGNSTDLRFEDFLSDTCKFDISMTRTPNPEGYVYPLHYKGLAENKDEGISINNFPKCAFTIDTYKAWLAQTANSRTIQALSTAGEMLAGAGVAGASFIATGGTSAVGLIGSMAVGGGLVSGGTNSVGLGNTSQKVLNMLAQDRDMSVKGQRAVGNVNTSWMSANNENTIHIQCLCAKPSNLQIIDDYFEKYGYAIHRLYKPSIKNRPHWNYIKTVGCDVKASLPAELVGQINSIHDNGITFWKNLDSIGDYSLDNRPV
jgi:hypothetical protein